MRVSVPATASSLCLATPPPRSWIVKQSVGTTPVLLGQKLTTRYFRGELGVGANGLAVERWLRAASSWHDNLRARCYVAAMHSLHVRAAAPTAHDPGHLAAGVNNPAAAARCP